jgi:catechol 2,3-dioxygenase-like lactoylglutathione lyase family enzyme
MRQVLSGLTWPGARPGTPTLVAVLEPGPPSGPARRRRPAFAVVSRSDVPLYPGAVAHLGLVTIVVGEYDTAIRFFVDALGFELVEDSPSLTTDGRPKRWVVVQPRGGSTGLLLAQADGDEQVAVVGRQTADRVGFFLQVEDFDAACARMTSAGVQFVRAPRNELYGQVAVFLDVAGNRWDLIGPRVPATADLTGRG